MDRIIKEDGMLKPIYLDNHAATRIDPRVLEAMMPYLEEEYGNPASQSHSYGWRAQEALEEARQRVARLMGAEPHEIVFTSGATESNNMVLRGAAVRRIVFSPIEHKSVLVPAEASHVRTQRLDVDRHGMAAAIPAAVEGMSDSGLVSLMGANNEVGTLQPLFLLAEMKECGARFLLHSDMAQMLGKERFDVGSLRLDFASVSAHKIHGPKGVGALYVSDRARDRLSRLMLGGRQENGLRPGTVNVPGAVGFGKACELAASEMDAERIRIRGMRNRLESLLSDAIPGMEVYGHPERRLAGNLCAHLPCADMTRFMAFLEQEVALSTGSACGGFSSAKSHVLKAMGVPEEKAKSVIRIGIGRFNTVEEMDMAADAIVRALDRTSKGG
jgi:cysteine desulfurase